MVIFHSQMLVHQRLSPYHGLPERLPERQELKGKADEKFEEIKGKASGHLEAPRLSSRQGSRYDGDMDCHGVIMGYHGFGYLDIYVMGYHGFGYWDIYIYIFGDDCKILILRLQFCSAFSWIIIIDHQSRQSCS